MPLYCARMAADAALSQADRPGTFSECGSGRVPVIFSAGFVFWTCTVIVACASEHSTENSWSVVANEIPESNRAASDRAKVFIGSPPGPWNPIKVRPGG